MKKIREQAKTISEADLKNHFVNSDEEKEEDLKAEVVEQKAKATKNSPPRPLDPRDDYQVQQALNYLKTMNFKLPAPSGAVKTGKR
jgi:hypothetical protein